MKWQLAQSGCSFAAGWRQLYCFSLQLSLSEPVKKKTFTVEENTNLTSPPPQLLLVSKATPFAERGGSGHAAAIESSLQQRLMRSVLFVDCIHCHGVVITSQCVLVDVSILLFNCVVQ